MTVKPALARSTRTILSSWCYCVIIVETSQQGSKQGNNRTLTGVTQGESARPTLIQPTRCQGCTVILCAHKRGLETQKIHKRLCMLVFFCDENLRQAASQWGNRTSGPNARGKLVGSSHFLDSNILIYRERILSLGFRRVAAITSKKITNIPPKMLKRGKMNV
jgi:hypothetical protein